MCEKLAISSSVYWLDIDDSGENCDVVVVFGLGIALGIIVFLGITGFFLGCVYLEGGVCNLVLGYSVAGA
ncbi:hypothetical protein AAHH78_43160, partial [Burkholderia pseudomallei]